MNKTETIKLARAAYAAVLSVAGRHAETAKAEALEGERRHRRGDFRRYHPNAAPAEACAELFVAKFVADYLTNADRIPGITDALRLRRDALIAAAIVATYADELRVAFYNAGIEPRDVATLDYTVAAGRAVVPA
jgi:hypothetical protein